MDICSIIVYYVIVCSKTLYFQKGDLQMIADLVQLITDLNLLTIIAGVVSAGAVVALVGSLLKRAR